MTDIPQRLETSRLILRQLEPDDAEPLHDELKRSYEHLAPWLEWLTPNMTLEERQEFCECAFNNFREGNGAIYGLWIRETGRLAGVMNASNLNKSVPSAEVGYWGAVETKGKGYISEAVRAISHHLIDVSGFERVWLSCDANNVASQRVAEHSGMQQEGRLRNARRDLKGNLSDTLIYSIIRD
ncbi:putative ribosomal N-acetyltransferase YdaF [Halomonadaceae bacterium LMG 33818]|uniref:GNAT family N-acetyltransferase n=1 Tax=Cernens ardua TaxID=3402176 RepID=UPI003EDBFA63